ncbi:MAG: hypothetical protein CM1200mP40_20410 [Gammaproteobacteria bacterium]|nr:MAG: hypothetical protein CM1200mP40_20410 [Gammaproteobacteria bacterium]
MCAYRPSVSSGSGRHHGQYDESYGGKIYLVESVDDVQTLKVNDPDKLSYVTQTTLSMDDTAKVIDALRDRFPSIKGPRKKDICYATQNGKTRLNN